VLLQLIQSGQLRELRETSAKRTRCCCPECDHSKADSRILRPSAWTGCLAAGGNAARRVAKLKGAVKVARQSAEMKAAHRPVVVIPSAGRRRISPMSSQSDARPLGRESSRRSPAARWIDRRFPRDVRRNKGLTTGRQPAPLPARALMNSLQHFAGVDAHPGLRLRPMPPRSRSCGHGQS